MAQQRLRMSDIFPDPNEDESPLALDEATRALYRRAIDNPSSLTDEERRTVTHRPSRPEEDELCRQASGLNFSELVRKAIDHRDSLSYDEASLLLGGLIPGEAGRWLRYRLRLSEADQDILHTAYDATWTEELEEARANANAVQKTWNQDSSAAGKFLNDDDIRHNILAMTVPWQEQVLSDTESEVCGLVGFYPDRDDWAVFREQIETAIYHGLHYRVQRIKNETIAKFTLHWVQTDNTLIRIYEVFSLKREIREDFRKVSGLILSCSSTERHCSPATRRDRLSGCGNRNVPVPPMKRKMKKKRKKRSWSPQSRHQTYCPDALRPSHPTGFLDERGKTGTVSIGI